jgi:hypothetical protein
LTMPDTDANEGVDVFKRLRSSNLDTVGEILTP